MKIAAVIARYLLGFIFVVFGLNGFLHFIKQPPPTGLALQYFTVMSGSHIMTVVYLCQLVGGALLLANRFVPIALTILGPVIVNILLFHVLMEPGGIAPGLLDAGALAGRLLLGALRPLRALLPPKPTRRRQAAQPVTA